MTVAFYNQESPMKDIHIKRMKDGPVEGTIEPEDKSWLVQFVDGQPTLMVRVQYEADDGTVKHGYLDVREIPPNEDVKEWQQHVFTNDVA
jgi:hypothetical protein